MLLKNALMDVRKLQYKALHDLLHFYADGNEDGHHVSLSSIRELNDLFRTSGKEDQKVTAEELNTPAEITDTYRDGSGGSAHYAVSLHLILNKALSTLSGLQQIGLQGEEVTDEQLAKEQAEADEVLKDAVKSLVTALGFDVVVLDLDAP